MPPRPSFKILTSVRAADRTERSIAFDENVIQEVGELSANRTLTMLLNAVRTDLGIRRLAWSHPSVFLISRQLHVPVVYSEADPPENLDTLDAAKERAEADLQVNFLDVLDKSLPKLLKILESSAPKFQSAMEERKSANPKISETELTRRSVHDVLVNELLPYWEDHENRDKLLNQATRELGANIGALLASMASVAPAHLIVAGRKLMENLKRGSNLDSDQYCRTIELMQKKLQILQTGVWAAWCPKCLGRPQCVSGTSSGDPPLLQCPACETRMHQGTYYALDPGFASLIQAKDGIIQRSVIWELIKGSAAWVPNAYFRDLATDVEKDAMFEHEGLDGYGVVECKTHQLDPPDRTVEMNLRDDGSQLLRIAQSFKDADVALGALALAVNLPEDRIRAPWARLMREDRFSEIADVSDVYGPERFDDLAKLLRGPEQD